MKKLFIVLIALLAFLVASCNGQKERVIRSDRGKNVDPIRTANYVIPKKKQEDKKHEIKPSEGMFGERNITNLDEKLMGENGYVLSGHFDLNSFDQNGESCLGLIWKNTTIYKSSIHYIYQDCYGNLSYSNVRK
jgi:hypothetical protein